jgi:BarA-like signal transduction histidine kinase
LTAPEVSILKESGDEIIYTTDMSSYPTKAADLIVVPVTSPLDVYRSAGVISS